QPHSSERQAQDAEHRSIALDVLGTRDHTERILPGASSPRPSIFHRKTSVLINSPDESSNIVEWKIPASMLATQISPRRLIAYENRQAGKHRLNDCVTIVFPVGGEKKQIISSQRRNHLGVRNRTLVAERDIAAKAGSRAQAALPIRFVADSAINV